jgi:transcriptional regulator with XRE-family HTH domain
MDMTMNQYLGDAARTARLRLELTQAQAASRIGLATEVYGRIERGHMTPSLPALMRMCRVLELDANMLLGFTSATPPPWLEPAPEHPRTRSALDELLRVSERLKGQQVRALTALARCMSSAAEQGSRGGPKPPSRPPA